MPLSVSLNKVIPAATLNSDSGLQHTFFFNETWNIGCFHMYRRRVASWRYYGNSSYVGVLKAYMEFVLIRSWIDRDISKCSWPLDIARYTNDGVDQECALGYFFRRVRKIAKSDYRFRRARLSVCPHGTTRLPLDGYLWNFIFEYFFRKSVKKNSSVIEIWQQYRILYIKAYVYLLYLAQFLLESETFQTNIKKNQNIFCSVTPPPPPPTPTEIRAFVLFK
jgi:hypothetical protein